MDLRAILAEIDAWSVEDRIRLIEALWNGLDDSPETLRLTPAQEQDLKNRVAASRSNSKAGSPWEEVKTRLMSS
jgi:putative addiction module component (TIGR02574 family)